jgi:signal peptidase I
MTLDTGTPTTTDIATPPARPPSLRGRGFLAVTASLLLPGLGHVLVGRIRRGLTWLAAVALLSACVVPAMTYASLTPALLVLFPTCVVLNIALLVDAYRSARRSPARLLRFPVARYFAGIAFLAAYCVVNPARLSAIPLQRYVVQTFVMAAGSMSPTIDANDCVIASKLRSYQRWDVIAFRFPEDPAHVFLKRLVGLPGETVEIRSNHVYINGSPIPSPAGITYEGTPRSGGNRFNGGEGNPVTLGPDEYYVLGDNSPISGDSRYWNSPPPGHQPGAVPRSHILGPVTWIYWPPARWNRLDRVTLAPLPPPAATPQIPPPAASDRSAR